MMHTICAYVVAVALWTLGLPLSAPPTGQEVQEKLAGYSFKLTPQGAVELTVHEEDSSTGKKVEKTYSARSLDEFRKKYPDVAKHYEVDRLAHVGTWPRPGEGDPQKSFEQWKKGFDDKWFWDQDQDEHIEKLFKEMPKSFPSEELAKWFEEQRKLFARFREIQTPADANQNPSDEPTENKRRLGVLIAPVGDTLAHQFGFDKPEGVVIAAVQKGSPAERAGLEKHDVVLKINGKPIPSPEYFRKEVLDSPKSIDLEVLRRGKRQMIRVEIPG